MRFRVTWAIFVSILAVSRSAVTLADPPCALGSIGPLPVALASSPTEIWQGPGEFYLQFQRQGPKIAGSFTGGPDRSDFMGSFTGKMAGKKFTGKFGLDINQSTRRDPSLRGTVVWTATASGKLDSTWTYDNGRKVRVIWSPSQPPPSR